LWASLSQRIVRIKALRDNSNFFRNKLKELGFRVAGDEDSPVIPLMLYHPAKIAGFSRLCLLENVRPPFTPNNRRDRD
jgi:serine palmitoyltransferase